MTVLGDHRLSSIVGDTCPLVLGGDVIGGYFASSPPNAGEIHTVSWQAILQIVNSPTPTDHKRRGSVAFREACFW